MRVLEHMVPGGGTVWEGWEPLGRRSLLEVDPFRGGASWRKCVAGGVARGVAPVSLGLGPLQRRVLVALARTVLCPRLALNSQRRRAAEVKKGHSPPHRAPARVHGVQGCPVCARGAAQRLPVCCPRLAPPSPSLAGHTLCTSASFQAQKSGSRADTQAAEDLLLLSRPLTDLVSLLIPLVRAPRVPVRVQGHQCEGVCVLFQKC